MLAANVQVEGKEGAPANEEKKPAEPEKPKERKKIRVSPSFFPFFFFFFLSLFFLLRLPTGTPGRHLDG